MGGWLGQGGPSRNFNPVCRRTINCRFTTPPCITSFRKIGNYLLQNLLLRISLFVFQKSLTAAARLGFCTWPRVPVLIRLFFRGIQPDRFAETPVFLCRAGPVQLSIWITSSVIRVYLGTRCFPSSIPDKIAHLKIRLFISVYPSVLIRSFQNNSFFFAIVNSIRPPVAPRAYRVPLIPSAATVHVSHPDVRFLADSFWRCQQWFSK